MGKKEALSIDLGFGFSEEAGGKDLCGTLPALNLYSVVNRQMSDPKLTTPPSPGSTGTSSSSSTLGGHASPRKNTWRPTIGRFSIQGTVRSMLRQG
ncbi:hypothetical protein ZIOFF_049409 [Zingiber officinale]|uniref:Uncharacterized protein n=1 Tax=Zingiber officinale TaxID=94328 RepID=A0A8J5FU74_ZINOF|nr:hypothetical protein ZIOFF_049409 [Zingiber officinale]